MAHTSTKVLTLPLFLMQIKSVSLYFLRFLDFLFHTYGIIKGFCVFNIELQYYYQVVNRTFKKSHCIHENGSKHIRLFWLISTIKKYKLYIITLYLLLNTHNSTKNKNLTLIKMYSVLPEKIVTMHYHYLRKGKQTKELRAPLFLIPTKLVINKSSFRRIVWV